MPVITNIISRRDYDTRKAEDKKIRDLEIQLELARERASKQTALIEAGVEPARFVRPKVTVEEELKIDNVKNALVEKLKPFALKPIEAIQYVASLSEPDLIELIKYIDDIVVFLKGRRFLKQKDFDSLFEVYKSKKLVPSIMGRSVPLAVAATPIKTGPKSASSTVISTTSGPAAISTIAPSSTPSSLLTSPTLTGTPMSTPPLAKLGVKPAVPLTASEMSDVSAKVLGLPLSAISSYPNKFKFIIAVEDRLRKLENISKADRDNFVLLLGLPKDSNAKKIVEHYINSLKIPTPASTPSSALSTPSSTSTMVLPGSPGSPLVASPPPAAVAPPLVASTSLTPDFGLLVKILGSSDVNQLQVDIKDDRDAVIRDVDTALKYLDKELLLTPYGLDKSTTARQLVDMISPLPVGSGLLRRIGKYKPKMDSNDKRRKRLLGLAIEAGNDNPRLYKEYKELDKKWKKY